MYLRLIFKYMIADQKSDTIENGLFQKQIFFVKISMILMCQYDFDIIFEVFRLGLHMKNTIRLVVGFIDYVIKNWTSTLVDLITFFLEGQAQNYEI
jgi:hypothetical protein